MASALTLVAYAALAAALLFLLDRLALWAESRGWIYYRRRKARPGTAADALLEVHSLLEPGQKQVRAARRAVEDDDADSGDPPAPGEW